MKTRPTKIKFHWEPIASDELRAKVIGGWVLWNGENGHMVFIPDQFHEWEIEK